LKSSGATLLFSLITNKKVRLVGLVLFDFLVKEKGHAKKLGSIHFKHAIADLTSLEKDQACDFCFY